MSSPKRNATDAGLDDDAADAPSSNTITTTSSSSDSTIVVYSPEPKATSDVCIVSKIDQSRLHLHSMILQHKCVVFRAMQDFQHELVVDATGNDLLVFFELVYGDRETDKLSLVSYRTLVAILRLSIQYGFASLEAKVIATFSKILDDDDVHPFVDLVSEPYTYEASYFDFLADLQGLATPHGSPTRLLHDRVRTMLVHELNDETMIHMCESCLPHQVGGIDVAARRASEPCRSNFHDGCAQYYSESNVALLRSLSPINRMKLLVALIPYDSRPLFESAFI
jgi:hypothetical protein